MATFVSSGSNFRVWNFTLSSSDDTQIVLNERVNTLVIRCRSAVDIYLKRSAGATDYFTIPSGTALTLDVHTGNLEPFSLKAASSSPVAEIIGIEE